MRIAVIGTGIAGMVAGYLLHRDHDLTLFEANDYIGGHTHTIEVPVEGRSYPVDTGFIVFNDWTYPNFIKLLARLGVASQPSEMSFSVRCDRTGLEYNGTSLNRLFAQRRNLFRPSFYRMLRDILRFNRKAPTLLDRTDSGVTLGEFLAREGYSDQFLNWYIIPMGAAIWSAPPEAMRMFPAEFFVRFFKNHGMLSVNDRPRWRVIAGGSREYVKALTAPYRDRIRLSWPVRSVTRFPDRVEIVSAPPPGQGPARTVERFDQVIFATHSDQALALLKDPTEKERALLGAFAYQENDAVLHTDTSRLPRRRLAWASWNYRIPREPQKRVSVTYYMNRLQRLRGPRHFCVTLNDTEAIDPSKAIARMAYHHPVYRPEAVAAQHRHQEVNGERRTYFCGAYWGYGFHEDGVNSALAVCSRFGRSLDP